MTTSAPRPAALGWYHGWNIVAVCVLSQTAALALTLNCFSLFLKDWTHDFSVPVSSLAIAVTIFSLGCSAVTPFAGAAADRFPARWVFGLALAGLVAFHVTMGFVAKGWQVVLLYSTVLPIFIGFAATVPAQALVSRWFVRRVGLAMGITAFGLALSSVIFPAVIVLLLPLVGWRVVWWMFAGVIAAVVLPVVLMVMRDRPTPEEGAYYVGTQARVRQTSSLTVRDVFSRRNFWVTIGVFVPIQCAVMGVGINLAPLVTDHGFSRTTAGLLISAGGMAGLVAKLAAGMLADRLGNRIPLVIVALISATGVAVLAFLGDHLPMLYLGMILIGLSGGVWTLLASATAAEFGADGFGRAFGIISAFTPIGALAPPIVAKLQEASGSYVAGLAGLAALSLIGAAVALLMRETRGASAPPAPSLAPEAAE